LYNALFSHYDGSACVDDFLENDPVKLEYLGHLLLLLL